MGRKFNREWILELMAKSLWRVLERQITKADIGSETSNLLVDRPQRAVDLRGLVLAAGSHSLIDAFFDNSLLGNVCVSSQVRAIFGSVRSNARFFNPSLLPASLFST